MERYIAVLTQTKAYFTAEPRITRKKFSTYYKNLDLLKKYPGMQGLGYVEVFPARRLSQHLREVRASGLPRYWVWPSFPRNTYSSIVFLEPPDWRNQRAFGYDMLTDPIHRRAMEQARDSGGPAISGRTILVQETTQAVQAGFLIYVPLYKADVRLKTNEDRLAALRGYIYSPFRTRDLFAATFQSEPELPKLVQFEVYDGEPNPGNLLYDSNDKIEFGEDDHSPDFDHTFVYELPGRNWTFYVSATDAFRSPTLRYAPVFSFVAGTLVTLLLFWLVIGTRKQMLLERRRLEEEKTAREKMELIALDNARLFQQAQEAVAVRDEFLSICSHELRTPLTSLRLQTQLLERANLNSTLSTERLNRYFQFTSHQVDRLVRLVEDMLDITRIQSGRLTVNPELMDLSQTVREVVERFSVQGKTSDTPIYVETPKPAVGKWDRFRIEQVIENLITNALKYGGGKPVKVRVESEGDRGRLIVEDKGIGIPKEHHHRIFERYERATSKQNISGLGLGLYIVKEIVEMHDGEVSVESEYGEGARFIVTLPLEENVSLSHSDQLAHLPNRQENRQNKNKYQPKNQEQERRFDSL